MPVPAAHLLGWAKGEVELPQLCGGGTDTLSLQGLGSARGCTCLHVCICVPVCVHR